MEEENLKFIHSTIIHQIDKTDSKANFLLILQLAIMGYFIIRLDNFKINYFNNCYILTTLIISVVLIITALVFIVLTIWPRLSNKNLETSDSLIYFKNIFTSFQIDNKKILDNFKKCNSLKFKNDLTKQIISLAGIALTKYRNIRISIIFISLQIIFLVLLFIISFKIQ